MQSFTAARFGFLLLLALVSMVIALPQGNLHGNQGFSKDRTYYSHPKLALTTPKQSKNPPQLNDHDVQMVKHALKITTALACIGARLVKRAYCPVPSYASIERDVKAMNQTVGTSNIREMTKLKVTWEDKSNSFQTYYEDARTGKGLSYILSLLVLDSLRSSLVKALDHPELFSRADRHFRGALNWIKRRMDLYPVTVS